MKFIIHIGAAKTGTTTIQNMLYKSHESFLGLCLEKAPIKKYKWQDKKKAYLLQRLCENDFIEQVCDVLVSSTTVVKGDKLVWSNEILLKYSYRLIPIIDRLKQLGHEVIIVCYLREHQSWLKSAYEQFNIFSKTYSGNIKSYSEWSSKNVPSYFKRMKDLAEKYPAEIYVKFIETVEDLCADFMNNVMEEAYNAHFYRDNVKRSAEELYVRAVFHDSKNGMSTAKDFNNSFQHLNATLSPDDYLNKLFEIQPLGDLELESIKSDKADLASFFPSLEVPEFSLKASSQYSVDNEKLLHMVTTIVMQQERRILALEELLRKKD